MDENNKFLQDDDRKLDETLDGMLSAYSAAEPRPGLETRILANLKEQSAQRSSMWSLRWRWAAAALASAAMITMVIYMARPKPSVPQPSISTQRQETPASAQQKKTLDLTTTATGGTKRIPSVRRNRIRIAGTQQPAGSKVAVVRQEVFPSPSPLSEQEKLLLSYLSRTPREELVAQSRPDPPEEPEDGDSKEPRLQNLIQVPQRNSNTR